MEKFTKIKSIAADLQISNIDTDMIIPKQFLKTIKRQLKEQALVLLCFMKCVMMKKAT